jgi:hypothetical protein
MSTAWVTSFSPDLYEATGKSLITSFETTNPCGRLFVGPENISNFHVTKPEKVIALQDPSKDPSLAVWLDNNKSIIPEEYGGSWTGPCSCPNPNDSKDTRHKPKCPSSWFCRNAVRWFRKLLTLRNFLKLADSEYSRVIWIDSDVIFKKSISETAVDGWFKGNSVFYLNGPKRKVWETGVVGFTKKSGIELIHKTFDCFMTGEFLDFPRWDDSYALQTVAQRMRNLSKIDLATGTGKHADVVPFSPLGEFIEHNKGTHGRILGIMK